METGTYSTEWTPKAYLAEYYLTDGPAEDEVHIFKFIREFLTGRSFATMLEFGCGPTIHHLIPFAEQVDEIYVADYLQNNLDEIQHWIDGSEGAHSWDSYIQGVLRLEETAPDMTSVRARESLLKGKIKALTQADIYDVEAAALAKPFPLVSSFYCIECTTSAKEKWAMGMQNLASLVAPGGWLLMSALRNCEGYRAGPHFFPSTSIDVED
jgi:hypothetical protein